MTSLHSRPLAHSTRDKTNRKRIFTKRKLNLLHALQPHRSIRSLSTWSTCLLQNIGPVVLCTMCVVWFEDSKHACRVSVIQTEWYILRDSDQLIFTLTLLRKQQHTFWGRSNSKWRYDHHSLEYKPKKWTVTSKNIWWNLMIITPESYRNLNSRKTGEQCDNNHW